MITAFPEFSDLTNELRPEVSNFTLQFPDYSDFNFVSLQSWNIDNSVQLSWLNQNLACRFRDYLSGQLVVSFLGNNQASQTAHTLLDYIEQSDPGNTAQLQLIPASSLGDITTDSSLRAQEDPDNFDYVISMPKLARLEGGAFTNVRKAARALIKHYPDAQMHPLDLTNDKNHQAMREVFFQREAAKDTDSTNEYLAFERLLNLSHELGVLASGVTVESSLRAFIVYEVSAEHQAAGHFWKADTDIKGLYQFLMHHLAKVMEEQGVQTMNIQQDLGISGLKRAKQFLRPIHFLKKYTISRVI